MTGTTPRVRDGTLTHAEATGRFIAIAVGSPAWFEWLDNADTTTFRFEDNVGRFTARKEVHRRSSYWYAYRRRAGSLQKVYVGRSAALTAQRLGTIAASLGSEQSAESGSRSKFSAAAPRTQVRDTLPKPLSSFVGRDRECAELRNLIQTERLITLVGSGGVGKTRLALRIAADAQAAFPDGVWVVELGSLTTSTDVVACIARTLRVRATADPLIDTLARELKSQHVLLVLDNCEHLLNACAEATIALLQACSRLCVLATSREPLGLAGEIVRRIAPLSVPDHFEAAQLSEIAKFEAIRLLVERVVLADPNFKLSVANAASVVRICRRLQGIPLALELAAVRVPSLGLLELATRLDQTFRLLETADRVAPARQRTLWATLDWSHALLSASERQLFASLAVFADGWTMHAAEAVCQGSGAIQMPAISRFVWPPW